MREDYLRHRPTEVVTWPHLEALLGWRRERIENVANAAGHFYRPFELVATGKPKARRIDNPIGELRRLQAAIQRRILARIELPDFVLGGVAGRSIGQNGEVHIGQPVVVTIDLKDFFPSVSNEHVYGVFRYGLGYAPKLAGVLTRVTTFHRHLPQGAPTSTALANLALLPAAKRIAQVALALDLRFTVWVDDVTLSGARAREAIASVIEIIRESGFAVACRKVKVQPRWLGAQSVTGVVVNLSVSFGQVGVRRLRREVFEARALGAGVPEYLLRSIEAKVRHVARLRVPQARGLTRLAARVLPEKGTEEPRPSRYVYNPCKRRRRKRVSAP